HTRLPHRKPPAPTTAMNAGINRPGRHSRLIMPFATPSPRIGKPHELSPVMRQLLQAGSVDPAPFEKRPEDVRGAIQAARRARGYETLSDDQLSDCFNYYVFPNTSFVMWADSAVVYRYRPDARDPDRSLLDIMSLSRAPAHGRPNHERWRQDDPRMDQVLAQDIAAISAVQRGMHSGGYRGLQLSAAEARIVFMH